MEGGRTFSTTDGELEQFFATCTDNERLLFQVFLCTGFRDRQVLLLTVSEAGLLGEASASVLQFLTDGRFEL